MEDNTSTPKEKFSYSPELANQILEIQNEIMDLTTKKDGTIKHYLKQLTL
jgi:hypothetical protein